MSKMDAMNMELQEKKTEEMFKKAETAMRTAEKQLDSPAPTPKAVKPLAKPKKTITPADSELVGKALDIEKVAKLVKMFAEKGHQVVTVQGQNCIKASVWLYIADLLGLHFEFSQFSDELGATESIPRERPVRLPDGTKFHNASDYTYVVLVECAVKDSNDKTISSGASYATSDEEFLKGRDPYHTFHMAQTRAIVRAMRNKYGHIVVAAGYSPVPFEEVVNDWFRERVDEEIKRRIAAQKRTK